MTEDRKWNQYANKNWNPYTGDNPEDGKCEIVNRYGKMACWACSMAYRLRGRAGYDYDDPFKPTFHPDKLDEPLKRKKPTIYATCFMGDLSYCQDEWMVKIMNVIRKTPRHTYLLLTKRPNIPLFRTRSFPDNVYFGVTVNLQSEVHRIDALREIDCKHKWGSFEAPFEEIECDLTGINGIAVGGLTGKHPFQPEPKWVIGLVDDARKAGARVVLKDNLKGWRVIGEWP